MPTTSPTLEELDHLLAQAFPQLAEWSQWKRPNGGWLYKHPASYAGWRPTIAIVQAWAIIEELNKEGYLITVSQGLNYYRHKGGRVAVQWKPENQNLHDCVVAETAPHAICLAAWRIKCASL